MHIHIDRIFTTVSRNLGIHDFSQHVDSWIEWAYEAEKLIGSKSTFKQKESETFIYVPDSFFHCYNI